jgi:hypothetical protein
VRVVAVSRSRDNGRMKLGSWSATATSGIQAGSAVVELSSHNTANAVTDGFTPLQVSFQALANGGVRVRMSRGLGGPDGAEAAAPAGDSVDLVEEQKNTVVGVAQYRANLRSLQAGDETEGVLLRRADEER